MTTTNTRPVNPYIAGRALGQPTGFFGRDDILRVVETDLRAPDRSVIVLFGQRRIGKQNTCSTAAPVERFVRSLLALHGEAA